MLHLLVELNLFSSSVLMLLVFRVDMRGSSRLFLIWLLFTRVFYQTIVIWDSVSVSTNCWLSMEGIIIIHWVDI